MFASGELLTSTVLGSNQQQACHCDRFMTTSRYYYSCTPSAGAQSVIKEKIVKPPGLRELVLQRFIDLLACKGIRICHVFCVNVLGLLPTLTEILLYTGLLPCTRALLPWFRTLKHVRWGEVFKDSRLIIVLHCATALLATAEVWDDSSGSDLYGSQASIGSDYY